MNDIEQIFTNIYDQNLWGKGSGPGSRAKGTEDYRKVLTDLLMENDVNSVLDYGCGDWQFSHLIEWPKYVTSYTGVDIVKSVIDTNIELHSNNVIRFEHCTNSYLFPDVDLIVCKDVLQHLSNKTISALLKKFVKHSKYIFITNDSNHYKKIVKNSDIQDGKWRPLDLSLAPWNIKSKTIYECQIKKKGHTKTGVLIISDTLKNQNLP